MGHLETLPEPWMAEILEDGQTRYTNTVTRATTFTSPTKFYSYPCDDKPYEKADPCDDKPVFLSCPDVPGIRCVEDTLCSRTVGKRVQRAKLFDSMRDTITQLQKTVEELKEKVAAGRDAIQHSPRGLMRQHSSVAQIEDHESPDHRSGCLNRLLREASREQSLETETS